MKLLFGIILVQLIVFGANIPKKFPKAKEMAVRLYHTHHLESFYTDTKLQPIVYIYTKKFPSKSIIKLQLGLVDYPYTSSKYEARGKKVEWEHIVPASWFVTADKEIKEVWDNGHEDCVTAGGTKYKSRKCAEKVSPLFNRMESDLYNLVPVIGALNAMRGSKNYGIIEGEEREFGETIDVEINTDLIEIMPSKRGNAARVMMYMHDKYGVVFPDHNNTVKMLKDWIEADPEDEWETEKKKILTDNYGMEF